MGKHDIRTISDRVERATVRMLKGARFRLVGCGHVPQHVFVAGMQRSGTNMVMEVLDRSFYTDVYHETDPRAFRQYEMRPYADIQNLAARSRAPHFVIKALCELDRLSSLMDGFPPAKALWILRDFDDSVNSALASFGNFAPRMARMSQDRMSDGWYGRGMSDTTHDLLRRAYHPNIGEASAAAMMWYYRNVLFFEQRLEQDPRVLLVKYEALVTEPNQAFPRIFRFLQIPYSPWIGRHVFASSIRRRPAVVIDPSIREACQALTHRFEDVLGIQRRREAT
jgi:hypothetical protein